MSHRIFAARDGPGRVALTGFRPRRRLQGALLLRDPLHKVSVRNKLALLVAGLCLLAFGVGGFLVSHSARVTLEEQILERLEFQCQTYATALDSQLLLLMGRTEDFASDGYIRDHLARITSLAGSSETQGETLAELRRELARHLSVNKLPLVDAFSALGVVDGDDTLVLAVPEAEEAALLETVALLPSASHKPWSSGLIASRDPGGEPTFVLAAPLLDLDDQQELGRLLVRVRAAPWLVSALRDGSPGKRDSDVRLTLHDGRGLRLGVSPRIGETDGGGTGRWVDLSNRELRVEPDRRPPDAGQVEYAPVRGVYSVALPALANGWQVEVSLDSEAALRAISGLQSRFLGVGLVLAALCLALLFFPMRYLVRPLVVLERAAQRIATGDLAVRVEVESTDEVGQLTRRFNEMAAALQERTSRLQTTAGDLAAREREVRAQHDRLNTVIASMRDGLVVLDGDGAVVLRNAAARPLLELIERGDPAVGIADGVHGRHLCHDGGLPDPSDCLACLFDPAGEPRSCTVNVGPRVFEVHTSSLAPDERGRTGRVLVSRDVTERVARDDRDIHQERLAVLGEVAAVMAHELNNPLASISMFNQMLATDLPEDSALQENVDVIQRNTEACKRTIRELLDYAAGSSPELGPIDIHETVGDVLRFLRPVSERSGVRVTARLEARNPWILGDEVQIRQVFVNLVMNGIQAVAGEGEVELATFGDGEQLVVDVADSGCGIPQEDAEQIFRPFFTTKSRGEGTGLGLPTARRITEMQGGGLELLTTSPAGTTFRVRLLASSLVEAR